MDMETLGLVVGAIGLAVIVVMWYKRSMEQAQVGSTVDQRVYVAGCAVAFILGGLVGLVWVGSAVVNYFTNSETDQSAAAPPAVTCDPRQGQVRLEAMHAAAGVIVSEADGWVIIQRGSAYAEMTPQRADAWVRLYADGDACANGRARRLEFQTPSGRVFARADEVRGIRMLSP